MKNKLIQIIKSVPITDKVYEEYISDIADKLLCEGIILPIYKTEKTLEGENDERRKSD